ncbi:uncharacterized protein LOC116611465 [Nematostella vectensis]|uniref:uncharacterized protein LOC116611465 n=1 Tax=Nematostella vectensis TaxID=45351 RepID=UPI0020773EB5|nr:uncharacterized protein LOC116611465 [Nematostella vectensis]
MKQALCMRVLLYIVPLWLALPFCVFYQVDNARNGMFEIFKGELLYNHMISAHHVTSPFECGSLCTGNPSCRSYNYKPGEPGEQATCQLNNSTKVANPSALAKHAQFEYYQWFINTQSLQSCLDIWRMRMHSGENGIFIIKDSNGTDFKVWCDFYSEPYMVWTLVLSYAYKNNLKYPFCSRSFSDNWPENDDDPNWNSYRMSLPRMQQIVAQSTHWRATAGFPVYGVDYRDYVRGNFASFDVMNFEGYLVCKDVELVNVRGINGRNTQAAFSQRNEVSTLYIVSSSTECAFNASAGSVDMENNFGYYCGENRNLAFRGMENDSSTTQWWFGGYM